MKQNIDFKTKQQRSIGQGIGDVPSRLLNCWFTPFFSELHVDRDSQQLGRDGPPGRARSPGISWLKDLHPISLLWNTTITINHLIHTKIQSFITI